MSNGRDPRFESLRICAIVFVVTHHVLLFGIDGCGYLSPFVADTKGVTCVAANSVVVTGVNLFVMISGWFGIHRIWRPFVRLVVECGVFGVVALVLSLCLYGHWPIAHVDGSFSLERLCQSVKFTNWWFITHYLMLVLVAPLLELGLKNIRQREFGIVLLTFAVLTFVFGFGWGFVNASGYNVFNFIMLYLLARYMRLFPQDGLCRPFYRWPWAIIVLCVGGMVLWFLLDTHSWVPGHNCKAWNYNSPLVIAESMALFALFVKLRPIKWNVVAVAPYVLGVYLLQSSPNLVYFRNALGSWLWRECGFAGVALTVAVLVLVCLLLSACILMPLRMVFRKVRL